MHAVRMDPDQSECDNKNSDLKKGLEGQSEDADQDQPDRSLQKQLDRVSVELEIIFFNDLKFTHPIRNKCRYVFHSLSPVCGLNLNSFDNIKCQGPLQ